MLLNIFIGLFATCIYSLVKCLSSTLLSVIYLDSLFFTVELKKIFFYIYLKLLMYLLLAVLSLLLHELFSLAAEGAAFHCSSWASRCGGFPCCGARALEHAGFSSCGSVVLRLVGSNLCLLNWQVSSLPLRHWGSSTVEFWEFCICPSYQFLSAHGLQIFSPTLKLVFSSTKQGEEEKFLIWMKPFLPIFLFMGCIILVKYKNSA